MTLHLKKKTKLEFLSLKDVLGLVEYWPSGVAAANLYSVPRVLTSISFTRMKEKSSYKTNGYTCEEHYFILKMPSYRCMIYEGRSIRCNQPWVLLIISYGDLLFAVVILEHVGGGGGNLNRQN